MSKRLNKLRREVEREQRAAERQQRKAATRPRRRLLIGAAALAAVAGVTIWLTTSQPRATHQPSDIAPENSAAKPQLTVTPPTSEGQFPPPPDQAKSDLGQLAVAKNQASGSYQRSEFGPGWGGYGFYPKIPGGCEARDEVLRRDLSGVKAGDRNACIIFSGVLHDPYTGKELPYSRYKSSDIQIDHVVALGAAWRTGASAWTAERRFEFANDINNMLAVDGQANNDKGSKTPDQWRPPRDFWCPYAERWVGIKALYHLTVTAPEKVALSEMLTGC
jgi:hypothetical protein